jgi:hypothetical protein
VTAKFDFVTVVVPGLGTTAIVIAVVLTTGVSTIVGVDVTVPGKTVLF